MSTINYQDTVNQVKSVNVDMNYFHLCPTSKSLLFVPTHIKVGTTKK